MQPRPQRVRDGPTNAIFRGESWRHGHCISAVMVENGPLARRLVLVIDDDTRSAQLLARLLRDDGWDVEVAGDGGAALKRLARAPSPDAIVTDFRMPLADGMAVAHFARARCPAVPVFMVTGYPELIDEKQLDPRPIVFTKPVSYVELTDALRSLPVR